MKQAESEPSISAPRNPLRRLRAAVVATCAGVLIAVVAGVGYWIWQAREHALEEAVETTMGFTATLRAYTDKTIAEIDSTLHTVTYQARRVEALDEAFYRSIDPVIETRRIASPYVTNLIVVDASGRVVHASAGARTTVGADARDREYFAAHVAAQGVSPYVSRPIRPIVAPQEWRFSVSRRLESASGGFLGSVVAFIDPAILARKYEVQNEVAGMSMTLMYLDGTVMTRSPYVPGEVGKVIPSFARYQGNPPERIHFVAVSKVGAPVRRVISQMRLKDYPLLVSATVTEDAALEGWYKSLPIALAVGVAMLLAIAAAGVFGVRQLGRREQEQERLAASQAHLSAIVENEPECVKLLDREGRVLDMNPAGLAMVEAGSLDEVRGQCVCPMVTAASRAAFEEMIAAVFRGEKRSLEFEIVGLNGTRRILETRSVPLWDEQQRAVRALLGVTRDVTERRRTEAALRSHEVHVRVLFDTLPLAIGHADAGGRITFVNRRYRETYSADADPVGRTIREVVGETAYAVVEPWIRRTLAGESVGFERHFIRADGTPGVRWLRYIPDRDGAGEVVGFFALIEDITERKITEERIAVALREKEVLLKEIYHRVKNNLQVVSSLLAMQGSQAGDESRALLAESANRVKSMALVHEQLYRSRDLSSIGFRGYLEQLVEHLRHAHGAIAQRVAVRADVEDVRLGIETAVPLGLIVNELVSNAYEHAYPDLRRGEIRLSLRELPDAMLELQVADDGVGLAPDFAAERVGSLGLQLVTSLAQQLDAKLEWASQSGVRVTLRFVPEEYENRRLAAA